MCDMFLRTATRAEYDTAIRLLEVAGYKWWNSMKPTEVDGFEQHKADTVIFLAAHTFVSTTSYERCKDDGEAVVTISDLDEIDSVIEVDMADWDAFIDEYSAYKWEDGHSLAYTKQPYRCCLAFRGNTVKWYCTDLIRAMAIEYEPQNNDDKRDEHAINNQFRCRNSTR